MAEERRSDGPTGRAYLDVPFSEKDDAKVRGARWDPRAKRWYDPHGSQSGLSRWAARPDVPEVLVGEDRSFGAGLFVDPVPRSCWFTNVRTCVSERDWERLRRPVVRRVGSCCEICGAGEDRAARVFLEVHERWHYDDAAGVQSLRRLIALCAGCHLVTHFGLATVTGRTEEAFAHLRAVTGMTGHEARVHVAAARDVWLERSARVWELDLAILAGAGIEVRRPAAGPERAAAAEAELIRIDL